MYRNIRRYQCEIRHMTEHGFASLPSIFVNATNNRAAFEAADAEARERYGIKAYAVQARSKGVVHRRDDVSAHWARVTR